MKLAGNEFQIACLELDKANKAIVEPLGPVEHGARKQLIKLCRQIVEQASFYSAMEEPWCADSFNLSPSNPDNGSLEMR